jgi:hypothetical protein
VDIIVQDQKQYSPKLSYSQRVEGVKRGASRRRADGYIGSVSQQTILDTSKHASVSSDASSSAATGRPMQLMLEIRTDKVT